MQALLVLFCIVSHLTRSLGWQALHARTLHRPASGFLRSAGPANPLQIRGRTVAAVDTADLGTSGDKIEYVRLSGRTALSDVSRFRTLLLSALVGIVAGFLFGYEAKVVVRRAQLGRRLLPSSLLRFVVSLSLVAVCAIGVRGMWLVVVTCIEFPLLIFALFRAVFQDAYRSVTTKEASLTVTRRIWSQGLSEMRTRFGQSVQATPKSESAHVVVVGKSGVKILQYFADRMMNHAFGSQLASAVRSHLEAIDAPLSAKLQARRVEASGAPELLAARAYDLGKDAIAFDVDIDWNQALEVDFDVVPPGPVAARIPVALRNVRVVGTVRCILAPLMSKGPGYGATLISFVDPPLLSVDVRIAGGEVTRVPWLRKELEATIQRSVTDGMLWPRRVVIPSMVPSEESGVQGILSSSELATLQYDELLLDAERRLQDESAFQRMMTRASLSRKARVGIEFTDLDTGEKEEYKKSVAATKKSDSEPTSPSSWFGSLTAAWGELRQRVP
eukprot:TRINITY_DN55021_c0_g1_i1.p1 TRINITY_DN55021_c0_g1~~TRINITY_DN55021_c0_g1_i1.p1  ORF type:complete len:502 (+),score=42.39 TRINITY_DN55021_c0_g1_i1:21-1526(+)